MKSKYDWKRRKPKDSLLFLFSKLLIDCLCLCCPDGWFLFLPGFVPLKHCLDHWFHDHHFEISRMDFRVAKEFVDGWALVLVHGFYLMRRCCLGPIQSFFMVHYFLVMSVYFSLDSNDQIFLTKDFWTAVFFLDENIENIGAKQDGPTYHWLSVQVCGTS